MGTIDGLPRRGCRPPRTLTHRRGVRPWCGLAAVVAVAAACHAATRGRSDPGASLRASLVLHDGQQGVAGEVGRVWTIEPDGTFRVAPLVMGRTGPTERTGTLAPGALRTLARAVEADLRPQLPPRLGGFRGANPRRLRVSYGETSSTLLLPPGMPLDAAAEPTAGHDGAVARFVHLFETARALVSDRAAEDEGRERR